MADRAGGEGDPGVPKEVFELDKDERWQARLEEARARREIALREKAAGKAPKPRPKPWEIEGSKIEKPPEIDPIIQERGDDKFDFADRLETIREGKDETPELPEPPKVPTFRSRAKPDYNPAPHQKVPAARGPEPRARPQPSLILPGAPDVAELAERYAATLEVVEDPEPARIDTESETVPDRPDVTLVPLPKTPPVEASGDRKKLTRAERRRGIRPLGMAFALAGLAALPFATEAPPLEKGPTMPVIQGFRFEPALGVTWSLNRKPVETRSGEWRPGAEPNALAAVPLARSATVEDSVAGLTAPAEPASDDLEWTGLAPVTSSAAIGIFVPDTSVALPEVTDPPAPRAAVIESTPTPLPRETAIEDATAAPDAPVENVSQPPAPENAAPVSAPPRPETLRGDETNELSQPPAAPQTAVEADPLRVTILAPLRSDEKMAEDIAADVQRNGHELVRVRDVEYSISERNVRYFHEQDRPAATRMAERYDAELRDFTWFRPKPVEGTAELWLSSREAAGTGGPRDQGATARGVDPGAFLGRVFDRLGLSTELPDSLPDGEN